LASGSTIMPRIVAFFAGTLFASTAIAKVVSLCLFPAHALRVDSVFPFLSEQSMLAIGAMFEFLVIICLIWWRRNPASQMALIIWTCGVFCGYRIAAHLLGRGNLPCPCLGSIPRLLIIKNVVASRILLSGLLCLLCGASISWLRLTRGTIPSQNFS
jgi:hypothetical protein